MAFDKNEQLSLLFQIIPCWFLWGFSKALFKQVTRRMDYLVVELTTDYDETGDISSLYIH